MKREKERALTEMDYSKYDFHYDTKNYEVILEKGLNEKTVRQISSIKKEPEWMTELRVKAYKHFVQRKMPEWGGNLSEINFDEITYYLTLQTKTEDKWEDVPDSVRKTFDRLGIPEAEKKFLAGVGAQYDSEVIYHKIREDLEKQGVVFLSMDDGLKQYPEIVKKYFGKIIPFTDNKFAALNTAVWSGGSFVFVPKNTKVDVPLQAYFRINAEKMGQFERTLIVAEEGSTVSYVEGCSAPIYSSNSLHSAVVELIALPGAHIRYTTIQNWSNNIYNLVTKRAFAYENASVEWLDCNLGCLTADTKVFTNSNAKNISDIEVGENVYSINQNFEIVKSKVIAKKINPPREIFKLTTNNYREIKATSNHPFLVMEKKSTLNYISWKKLEDIKNGDWIACAGKIPDDGKSFKINASQSRGEPIAIPGETTKELMWLLGFYIGDGYTDKNRVYFAVPEKDKSRKRVIETTEKIFSIKKHEKRGVVIRFNSTAFVDFLEYMGFKGNARNKTIPHWVYTLPKEQKLAFIEGYIDADGHVRKGHKNISITSVNKKLLEGIKTLAIFCGLNPSKISKWSRKEKKPLGKEEKLYEHYFLYFGETKFDLPIYFAKVIKKEDCEKEITYDIEVEGTANFIANGIFAHNSKLTMKYPSVFLLGEGSRAEVLSVAIAGKCQHQDAGAKAVHVASNTTSRITSKSISKDGGRTSYRGLVKVHKGAKNVKSSVRCDALLLDEKSRSDTYPYIEIDEPSATIAHEASVGKIGDGQLFYLMSRGLSQEQALTLIVLGFIQPFTKQLPMEYALEMNRLIEMEMEGSVG